jgi:hypothetical protein
MEFIPHLIREGNEGLSWFRVIPVPHQVRDKLRRESRDLQSSLSVYIRYYEIERWLGNEGEDQSSVSQYEEI